jgi:3-hydroxyisobutyrate dehydrogenase
MRPPLKKEYKQETAMTQRIAFIGLGNMGGPMAANLAGKGFTVCAFDLSPTAQEKARAAGCHIASTPLAAADGASVVISMLPNGAIVESVYIDGGLLAALPANTLVIDSSTVSPATSRRVADAARVHRLRFIDAPVSGGVAVAAAGKLAFMCGGAEADVEAARPVLGAMGANIFRAGDHGAGSVAKICNNMLLAVHMIGTAEALALGVKNGMDPKVLSEIMLKSSGSNWSLEKYNPFPGVMEGAPASRHYQGGFMINLMLKDLGLALEAARDSGSSTPMGSLANSLYALFKSQEDNGGNLDFSAIQGLFHRPTDE